MAGTGRIPKHVSRIQFGTGGRWGVTLHGPDGADYPNEYFLLEVAELERLVIGHPDPAHNFQLTITFAEEGSKTRLTWRMRFDSAEHCQEVKSFVIPANEQVLDRLEAELARMSDGGAAAPAAG